MTSPQRECHQHAGESCTSYNDGAQPLQQRCAEIRSFSEALLDRRRMAAGDATSCKLVATRGPIQLLRRFNGGSRHQRRVSEEGSLSLKRRNLRCVSEAVAYCNKVRKEGRKRTGLAREDSGEFYLQINLNRCALCAS